MVEISNVVLYCWTPRTYRFSIFSWTRFLWQPFVTSTLWSPYSAVSVAFIKRRSGSFPAQFECHTWGQAAAPARPSSEFCNVICILSVCLVHYQGSCEGFSFILSCDGEVAIWCHVTLCRVMLCRLLRSMIWRLVVWYIYASVLKFLPREGKHETALQ